MAAVSDRRSEAEPGPERAASPAARWDGRVTELEPGLWQRPDRKGYQESLRGLGGIVAPLLTGFSLAAIAQLATAGDPPQLAGWSILALAGASCLLLYSMQVAFLALERNPSPAELLAWYPEATVNRRSLEYVRKQQARDFVLMQRYERRHQLTYGLGILLFLAGLALVAWPDENSPERYAAVAVVALAWIVEAVWTGLSLFDRESKHRRWHPALLRPPSTVELSEPEATELAAVLDPGRRQAAELDYPKLNGPGTGDR